MGAEAAALQEATPVSVMVAAMVLETVQTGACTGTEGGGLQPSGTITLKVYCCELFATVWLRVAVAGVTV